MKVIMLMVKDTVKESINIITVIYMLDSGTKTLKKVRENYFILKKTLMKASS